MLHSGLVVDTAAKLINPKLLAEALFEQSHAHKEKLFHGMRRRWLRLKLVQIAVVLRPFHRVERYVLPIYAAPTLGAARYRRRRQLASQRN